MKKQLPVFLLAILCIFMACNDNRDLDNPDGLNASEEGLSPKSTAGEIIPDQYIIELKPTFISSARSRLDWSSVNNREEKAEQMKILMLEAEKELNTWLARYDINQEEVLNTYTAAIVGIALKISKEKYEEIRKDREIASIEQNRMVYLPDYVVESVIPEGAGSRAPQAIPCGITNVGGFANGSSYSTWIWVIDTGIDLDHPDLNVNSSSPYAKTFVGSTPDDCNGHGTHVAGTAAAINNSFGVVGVSAGATVVPVRVFGCTGGSTVATVISAINHVAVYDLSGDALNMSLTGYYGSGCSTGSSYISSLLSVTNGGTRVAIASGNNNSNAAEFEPGCVNGSGIYTVTNMRCNRSYYNDPIYGGNYGRPPVDWIATGTDVYSTYRDGGYATLTGTSMATPHVAGIVHWRNAGPISGKTIFYQGTTYPIAKR